jgi:signal transduction histidine kinase
LNDQHKDFINEIISAGNHLLGLVDDVLDFSRIDSGSINLSPEQVRCSLIIDECLALTEPAARSSSVSLHTGVIDDVMVLADRARLKQVLMNLLSNAVKYNRPEGSVVVDTALQGDTVRITVTDTGYGVPEELRDGLFVSFNRSGRESGKIEGAGIGLAFSKKLVELMGGRIGYRTAAESGSSFWVELPGTSDAV